MMDRRVRKQNEFIERARAIHGDKYDYSQVVYRTCKDKVRIVCPIHGVFEQTPEHHAYCGHGCLKCRPAKVKETVRSRYGVDYVSQSAGFQAKVEETNLRKYGVRRPMQSEDIRCKSVATSRRNWGTDYPMQNAEIAELYKRRFVEKYGVTGPLACDEIARRVRSTVLSRYGVENPMQDPTVIAKQFSTRTRTGTACTSSGEDRMCEMLVDRFGTDDVFFNMFRIHIRFIATHMLNPWTCISN